MFKIDSQLDKSLKRGLLNLYSRDTAASSASYPTTSSRLALPGNRIPTIRRLNPSEPPTDMLQKHIIRTSIQEAIGSIRHQHSQSYLALFYNPFSLHRAALTKPTYIQQPISKPQSSLKSFHFPIPSPTPSSWTIQLIPHPTTSRCIHRLTPLAKPTPSTPANFKSFASSPAS